MDVSDNSRKQQVILCEVLGLDPAEITHISIEVDPLTPPVLQWSGRRRLTPAQLQDIIDAVSATS